MGKKNKGKKAEATTIPATEAMVEIDKLKQKVGEHTVATPFGDVTIVAKKQMSGLTGEKEIRAMLRFRDIAIGKMALKALMDAAGRAAGETPTTRKVVLNNTYKKWAAKHPEIVSELLGEDEAEADPAKDLFTADELKVKIKRKAFKKAMKKSNGMFDKDECKNIMDGAFKGDRKASVQSIMMAIGDAPTSDMASILKPLL